MECRVSRRSFLKAGAAFTGLAALGPRAPGALAERPNVLVIYTDQQSTWTLGAYGGTVAETPHIDSLAREGAMFTNFFVTSALCTPSRGCFFTGRYPHCHGAHDNNVAINNDEITFAHILARQGYVTGYAGKWHLNGSAKPGWVEPHSSMGFADCQSMFNRGHWKKIVEDEQGRPTASAYRVIGDEKTYTTDWLCDKTIRFIERSRKNPFCYVVSIPDPHPPYTVRAPYDTLFDPDEMCLPTSLEQRDVPRWVRRARDKAPAAAALRARKARYFGQVKCIDDNVGRILDCLRGEGILDNTIVVFTSDHGEYMGEHGLMGKNELYETAHHVPLLIRWPSRIAAGTRIDQIVSAVDFQQTLLGLLRVGPAGREQGRDASSLLRGEGVEWTSEAFIHHNRHKRAGIFTPEFELAYVKGSDAILFDRKNDPAQMRNLFHEPAYKDVISELTARVIRHHADLDSPAARWLKDLQPGGRCAVSA